MLVLTLPKKKHGHLAKTQAAGDFVDEWNEALKKLPADEEIVDVTSALSIAGMAVKDEKELSSVRNASRASAHLLRKYLVDEMSEVLDEEKKVSHRAFSDKVNSQIENTKYMQSLKVGASFDAGQLDWAVAPLIESGGAYDLRLHQAQPDENNLHAGVIIAALGFRYATYSSLVARTYFVDPNKAQDNVYNLLLEIHETVIKEIKEGAIPKNIYEKALGLVKSKNPQLEEHFLRSVGYGIGIETRDNALLLNAKNTRPLKDGMTLVVMTGFADIDNPKPQDKKSAQYSLMLADTVRVAPSEVIVFTKDAPSDRESVSFFFKDETDEKPAKASTKKDSRIGAVAQGNIRGSRLRHERQATDTSEKDRARHDHQKELHQKKQEEGKERFKADSGAMNGVETKKFKRFESYKRDNQFPLRVKDLVICVDERAQSIVLPIMGRPVPFHINTVKNASTNQEGGFAFLRINFLSPGQGVGRKDDQPFEDINAHFVRSLTFKSKDFDRMEDIVREINNLKKSTARKEQEKKDMEDVIEQDKLQEIRNRRPVRTEPVFLRPALEGKRLPGSIEIHQNGMRYQHQTGQIVDILFSNIKHLFFQPCDHELIVIIHMHLISPILVGKKKTKDVQFYREATEMAFDETGNRKRKHRYGDEEEFEQEQEERRRRAQLNREFKAFAERISDAARAEHLSVDIPFRELGFNGVPSRSSVLVQPTTDCLVQLTEPPFLVISLSDIEVVHLERVQFGLKNFDMVVILHDFQKPPIHVNTIPVESLDAVKDWLDSVDIPFSEGPMNLNWGQIMKTVTSDPHAFFAEGGWHFLSTESDSEEQEQSEDEESAFEMSDSEVAGLSGDSSEDESEFDEDASADASDDEADGVSDEGEDWDEMEEKAKKSDKRSGLDAEDESKGKKSKGRR